MNHKFGLTPFPLMARRGSIVNKKPALGGIAAADSIEESEAFEPVEVVAPVEAVVQVESTESEIVDDGTAPESASEEETR